MRSVLLILFLALSAITFAQPERVIYDTDLGYDVDDVGALAVLHALADLGEADILATISEVSDPYARVALDVINTYYGRPNIPIGQYKGEKWRKAYPYWRAGSPYFIKQLAEDFPYKFRLAPADAVDIYRLVLSRQPDKSVTIIAVGFLQNLSDLLGSEPDRYSALSGRELVERKVKLLTIMGGSYPASTRDFNIGGGLENSAEASQNVLANWPTEIVLTPGNVCGGSTSNGHTLSRETPKDNPVRAAYELFNGGPNRGRTSWDLCTVLYGVRFERHDGERYFSLVRERRLVVQNNKSHRWVTSGEPHGRLQRVISEADIERALEELLTAPPAGRRN